MASCASPVGRLAYAPLTMMLGALNTSTIARAMARAACFMERYDIDDGDDASQRLVYASRKLARKPACCLADPTCSCATTVGAASPRLTDTPTAVYRCAAQDERCCSVDHGLALQRLCEVARSDPLSADQVVHEILFALRDDQEGLALLTALAQMGLTLPNITAFELQRVPQLDSVAPSYPSARPSFHSQLRRLACTDGAEPSQRGGLTQHRLAVQTASTKRSRLERMRAGRRLHVPQQTCSSAVPQRTR